MRFLPFTKGKKGVQFAGIGFDVGASSGILLDKKEYDLTLSSSVNWYTVDSSLKNVDFIIPTLIITNLSSNISVRYPNGYNDGDNVVNCYVASDTGLSFYGKVFDSTAVSTKLIVFYKESEV